MFSKLAFKNVGRSMKDYGVWFLTIAFGVCLFYVFNSLETQAVFQYLGSGPQAPTAQAIRELIGMLSVFVWVVLAFLILYASGFLIRRRKGELGTYLLLGMERGQVARLLLLETLCMGVLALLAGLGLGVLAAWGLSAFTAGLFAVPMTEFTFSVSLAAMGKTALAFSLIFLLVMLCHAFAVSRCRLLDLMQARRVNQELKAQSLGVSVVLFLAGAGLLAVAYAMLLTRGLLRVDALFWVMIGLGSLGTLLFFRSLSGFLLRVCQSSKRLYYRTLTMFVLRQFNARINTTYRSMTVICLMLLLAIGITASSVGLNNTVEQMTAEQAPQDVGLIFCPEQGGEVDLPALLAEGGFDPEAECAFSLAVPVYRTGEERAITQSMHDAIAGRWGQDAAYAFRAHHGLDVQPDDAAQGAHIDGWYFLADYAGDKYAAEARFQVYPGHPGRLRLHHPYRDLDGGYGHQGAGALHRPVPGGGVPAGLGGGAGPSAAHPGGGQRPPLPAPGPAGRAGADAGPVGGYPGIPLLFPAPGPGAGPRRRGHDGGQRGDRRGREGGRGGLQRRGGGSAAGHLRRLFPGHLLGQPPDRAERLRNAKKCLKSAGKCATIESTFESGAG